LSAIARLRTERVLAMVHTESGKAGKNLIFLPGKFRKNLIFLPGKFRKNFIFCWYGKRK